MFDTNKRTLEATCKLSDSNTTIDVVEHENHGDVVIGCHTSETCQEKCCFTGLSGGFSPAMENFIF